MRGTSRQVCFVAELKLYKCCDMYASVNRDYLWYTISEINWVRARPSLHLHISFRQRILIWFLLNTAMSILLQSVAT